MKTSPLSRAALALVFAALAFAAPATHAQPAETVLVSNSLAKVTKTEYEAELLRLPPDLREGFANNPRRVGELLLRMLVQKSLAAQARNAKLDARPDVAARVQLEVDRFLATIEIETMEAAANAEFNANLPRYEARAREIYLVDKASFTNPPTVSATHILFDTKKHTSDEAKKLATETRAKIAAGADMGTLAKELSEDPTAATNNGALGWFTQKDMDPGFATAAFALANVGDLSAPVQSQFGWHVIRLDGKRAATTKTYEESRDAIIAELRKRFADEKREAAIAAIRKDPKMQVNGDAVNALTPKVDPGTIRRAQEGVLAAPPAAPK